MAQMAQMAQMARLAQMHRCTDAQMGSAAGNPAPSLLGSAMNAVFRD
jgi:hypothetical protein